MQMGGFCLAIDASYVVYKNKKNVYHKCGVNQEDGQLCLRGGVSCIGSVITCLVLLTSIF